MVLEDRPGLARRAQGESRHDAMTSTALPKLLFPAIAVPSAAVHHRYITYPCQRIQGSAGFRRAQAIHHRKGRRGDSAAKESHVFQPYR